MPKASVDSPSSTDPLTYDFFVVFFGDESALLALENGDLQVFDVIVGNRVISD